MIWLYWRRVRLAVLVATLATSAIAAIVVGVAFLAGADRAREADLGDGQVGVDWQVPGGGREAPAADNADDRRGLRLMQDAAAACQTVSYHGNQLVAWSGPGGTSTYLIKVSHRPGSPEQADGDDDGHVGTGAHGQHASAGAVKSGGHVVAGVLSVSPWMLALMRSNYVITYSGTGMVLGRPAVVVTLRRRGGALAGRYWLDQVTGLPLRRQVFDSGGHLVNEGAFTDLTIGSGDLGDAAPPSAVAWNSRPVVTALASLRKQGWLVPAALADNLALVSLTTSSTRSGAVVDASYSDGLSVVSVFMQRGELPLALPGWHRADVSGLAVLSSEPDERSLAWSAQGVVYTVIADAPRETVDGVVAGLPHDHDIGFWQRVGRGLSRMGSWFDPFG